MYTKTKTQKKKKKRNPNPNVTGLLRHNPKVAPEGSAAKPVQVRIPASQYDDWMSLPAKKRNESLRKFIAQVLAEEKQSSTC